MSIKAIYSYFCIYPKPFVSKLRAVVRTYRSIIDRFGDAPLQYGLDISLDRKPKLTKRDFKDICIDRVHELIKIANGRKIVAMSSCGVDSLAVICSFIQAGEADKLEVIAVQSNEQNEIVIDALRKANIKYTIVEKIEPSMIDGNLLTDGNVGDQLFGTTAFFGFRQPRTVELVKSIRKHPEIHEPLLNNSVLDVSDDKTLAWYISYAYKWRHTQYIHLPNYLNLFYDYVIDINNYYAFFATDEFSDWAYTHHEKNLSYNYNDPAEYKKVAKDFIISTFSDETVINELKSIGKFGSLWVDNGIHLEKPTNETYILKQPDLNEWFNYLDYDNGKYTVKKMLNTYEKEEDII